MVSHFHSIWKGLRDSSSSSFSSSSLFSIDRCFLSSFSFPPSTEGGGHVWFVKPRLSLSPALQAIPNQFTEFKRSIQMAATLRIFMIKIYVREGGGWEVGGLGADYLWIFFFLFSPSVSSCAIQQAIKVAVNTCTSVFGFLLTPSTPPVTPHPSVWRVVHLVTTWAVILQLNLFFFGIFRWFFGRFFGWFMIINSVQYNLCSPNRLICIILIGRRWLSGCLCKWGGCHGSGVYSSWYDLTTRPSKMIEFIHSY